MQYYLYMTTWMAFVFDKLFLLDCALSCSFQLESSPPLIKVSCKYCDFFYENDFGV